jgi:hypothetical protein
MTIEILPVIRTTGSPILKGYMVWNLGTLQTSVLTYTAEKRSLLWQLHFMCIIVQWHTTNETAEHYGLPPAVINAYLHKEAAALIGAVVEVDASLILPSLGQVGTVLEHPVQLHGW